MSKPTMSKQELIDYACDSMDTIAMIVNSIDIRQEKDHYFMGPKVKKEDVCHAIWLVQHIVNKIQDVEVADE